MVTECWLGFLIVLDGVRYGRRPVCGWKFCTWARWFTHRRTEFACVCVHVYICGQGFAMCARVCSRVCTQIIHVCVHVNVYAHRECMCVYMYLHIMCACTYFRNHVEFHVSFSACLHTFVIDPWRCNCEQVSQVNFARIGFVTNICCSGNIKEPRTLSPWNVLSVRIAVCWLRAGTWLQGTLLHFFPSNVIPRFNTLWLLIVIQAKPHVPVDRVLNLHKGRDLAAGSRRSAMLLPYIWLPFI